MSDYVGKFIKLIFEGHSRTICQFYHMSGISYGFFQIIIMKNLNVNCIAVKFVLWLLTLNQKQWHVDVCLEFHELANSVPHPL